MRQKRRKRSSNRINMKTISIGAIVIVLLLAISGMFGGDPDVSDSVDTTRSLSSSSSVEAQAENGAEEQPVETQPVETQPVEEHSVESPPAEQPEEVQSDSNAIAEAPATESTETPVESDPVPVEETTPSDNSVSIDLGDSSNYSQGYSEPEGSRAIPDSSVSSGEYVYISETGSKYHNDPNCSNMNYRLVPLQEALNKGLEPCKKCYGG